MGTEKRYSNNIKAKLSTLHNVNIVRCVQDTNGHPTHQTDVLVGGTTLEHAIYSKKSAMETFDCDEVENVNHIDTVGQKTIVIEPISYRGQITATLQGIHAGIIVGSKMGDGKYENNTVLLDSVELAELIRNLQELQIEVEKSEFKHLGKDYK